MNWHPEILASRQERVLDQIGPALSRRGFYLAGGTAVALHLGHRRSVDFDWFTPEWFDPLNIAQELREEGVRFVTESTATGTLHGMVRGVPISLLRYNYPLLASLPMWRCGIRVAARADLGAMKLAAVAQRGAKKDFVDIYALCQNSKMLRLMLQRYRKKYSVQDLAHLLYSLTYFDDADSDRIPRMLWDVRWRIVKETIRHWVQAVPR